MNWNGAEFEKLLGTVEGQFKVMLSPEIGRKVVFGDVELDLPLRQKPIYIEKRESDYWNDKFGIVNSNSDPKVMEIICRSFKCLPTEGDCIEPVRFFGHCCDQCGAYVNLSMNLEGNKDLIYNHVFEQLLKRGLHKYVEMYMERMDSDAAPLEFQISLFEVVDEKNKKPKYNEDKFVEAVKVIEDVLDSHIGGVAISAIHHTSKISRSVHGWASWVGKILVVLVVGSIVVFVLKKDTGLVERIGLSKRKTNSGDSTKIVWRRGDMATEDVLMIDNPSFTRFEELGSEEENPQLEEPQPSSSVTSQEIQEDPSILIEKPTKENSQQPGDMEMSLIEI